MQNMEIHYTRNLMTSYMVLEQAADWMEMAAWEHEMILHSQIPEIIFGESVRENDNAQLWYDISGKQSLDTVLDTPVLSYKLLCIILAGIYEAVEKLESFLLRADSLILQPECIFLDSAGEQIYFCYGPKSKKTVTETFCELMEYLLTRLDHTEEKSLELAYRLYDQSTKEGFCLSQLQGLLRIDYERETEQEEKAKIPEEGDILPKDTPDNGEGDGYRNKNEDIKQKITNINRENMIWKNNISYLNRRSRKSNSPDRQY